MMRRKNNNRKSFIGKNKYTKVNPPSGIKQKKPQQAEFTRPPKILKGSSSQSDNNVRRRSVGVPYGEAMPGPPAPSDPTAPSNCCAGQQMEIPGRVLDGILYEVTQPCGAIPHPYVGTSSIEDWVGSCWASWLWRGHGANGSDEPCGEDYLSPQTTHTCACVCGAPVMHNYDAWRQIFMTPVDEWTSTSITWMVVYQDIPYTSGLGWYEEFGGPDIVYRSGYGVYDNYDNLDFQMHPQEINVWGDISIAFPEYNGQESLINPCQSCSGGCSNNNYWCFFQMDQSIGCWQCNFWDGGTYQNPNNCPTFALRGVPDYGWMDAVGSWNGQPIFDSYSGTVCYQPCEEYCAEEYSVTVTIPPPLATGGIIS
jgi:hypothetical protein